MHRMTSVAVMALALIAPLSLGCSKPRENPRVAQATMRAEEAASRAEAAANRTEAAAQRAEMAAQRAERTYAHTYER